MRRLASALRALGVEPGATVAMMDWDSHRYLECFFAVPMMGAVLHTVNVRISPDQILYTINHAAGRRDPRQRRIPAAARRRFASRSGPACEFVLINDGAAAPQTKLEFAAEYEAMLAKASPSFAFPALRRGHARHDVLHDRHDRPAEGRVLQPSAARAACVRDDRALANAPHATFTARDVYMPITPMFHVHAWGFPYVATMLGVKQVYPGRYVPDTLLGLIARERVTFSHCVPTILQMMLGSPAAAGHEPRRMESDHRRLRAAAAAGARRPRPRHRRHRRLRDVGNVPDPDARASDAGDARLEPSEETAAYRCRAGRPIPFVELRIVDADMNDVPHDGASQGEIVVRTPWLTQGYLGEPERSEELWRGGWLHTGDVGVIDGDGYLKIVDRIKDVVKTGGEWVSSLDIEDVILRLPGIAEAAVVGVPDDKWGERPVALVRLQAGHRRGADRGRGTSARRASSRSAARSRSTRCPTACTSSTRSRRPASASSTRK